jgi:hypothetical protein
VRSGEVEKPCSTGPFTKLISMTKSGCLLFYCGLLDIKKDLTDGTCSKGGGNRNSDTVLVGKPLGK